MAKKIDSYNAAYPAAYYEIGTVYAFYAQGDVKGLPATDKQIQRFSSALKNLEERSSTNAIQSVKGNLIDEPPAKIGRLSRYYAVVVEKNPTNIEVMFLNRIGDQEDFLTKKYTVNGSAFTDGKDLMTPATHTSGTGCGDKNKKIGGITKSGNGGKVGGITKAGNTSPTSSGIGGITKASKTTNEDRVGGITRMNKTVLEPQSKIGGITRMQK